MYAKKTGEKVIIKKDGKKVQCTLKVNTKLIVSGFFNELLRDVVYGKLQTSKLEMFMRSYIKLIKCEIGRSFPRVSKTPFEKWYVKAYHKYYENTKVLDAVKNNDKSKLNKNLKLKTNGIELIDE